MMCSEIQQNGFEDILTDIYFAYLVFLNITAEYVCDADQYYTTGNIKGSMKSHILGFDQYSRRNSIWIMPFIEQYISVGGFYPNWRN